MIDCEEDCEIKLITSEEIQKKIDTNIEAKEAPGIDFITGKILKELLKKAIIKLTYLFNAAFRLRYVPKQWKEAVVIIIPKPGKPPEEVTSYRAISLLPIISKLFEKLLLKRLKPIIERKQIIPSHQFGFREEHLTIDQVHRITDIIEKCLKERRICSAVFLVLCLRSLIKSGTAVWNIRLENFCLSHLAYC